MKAPSLPVQCAECLRLRTPSSWVRLRPQRVLSVRRRASHTLCPECLKAAQTELLALKRRG